MRGEYKTPGGKLVGVNVEFDAAGFVVSCSIDGDFFLEGADGAEADALIDELDRALVNGDSVQKIADRHPAVRFVGTDVNAIEIAFQRAIGDAGSPAPGGGGTPTSSPRSGSRRTDARAGRVGDQALWRRRWASLHPRVVHDTVRSPAEQMRVDEQWARLVASGDMPATLRIWEWGASAVVIGRFQSLRDQVNLDEARRERITVVRRCTGGGAMFIEPGNTITYSLYAPRDFADGVGIERSYQLCDQWLVDALRGLGLDVGFAGINDIASQHGKIGGAAQRRFPPVGAGPGSILHHVTLAYDIDAEKMGRVLNTSREKMSDKAVKSAVKRVDPLRSQTGLSRQELVEHLLTFLRRDTI